MKVRIARVDVLQETKGLHKQSLPVGIATRVWVVGVPVSSFDKALAFYRGLLGFKVQIDARQFNWMELGPDEPLCKIGLFEHKEGLRKPGISTGIILDTDDIHEFHRRLSSKGVKFTLTPEKQVWGGMQADFEDFDGNKLEVVQDSEHYSQASRAGLARS